MYPSSCVWEGATLMLQKITYSKLPTTFVNRAKTHECLEAIGIMVYKYFLTKSSGTPVPLWEPQPEEHCCISYQNICDLPSLPGIFCLRKNQGEYTYTEEPLLMLRSSSSNCCYCKKCSKKKKGKGREWKKRNTGFSLSLTFKCVNSAYFWHNNRYQPGKGIWETLWVSIFYNMDKAKNTRHNKIYSAFITNIFLKNNDICL